MPDGIWGTAPVFQIQSNQFYFYDNDHLGTPHKLSDTNGTIAWSADYTPFGRATTSAVATVINNLRFPGQYFDAETGLHQNRFRDYDVASGRYVTTDIIGLSGGLNLFNYGHNNPLRWIDSMGLFVLGKYNRASGQLTVIDLETGQRVTIQAESGGKPFGDPIPSGTYDILERQGRSDFYRLDKHDATPYDDVDDVTGRTHFRLHRPGRTIGCIAAKEEKAWKLVDELIKKTQRTEMVPDNFKPWWKLWPTVQQYVIRYGSLIVN